MAHEKLFDESAYDYVIRGRKPPDTIHNLTIARATNAEKNENPIRVDAGSDEPKTIIPEHSQRSYKHPWYK